MQVKKIVFMAGKLWNDLLSLRNTVPLTPGPYDRHLGYYYIRFESDFKKLNRLLHSFDTDGIPLNTTYIDVENPQLHYYPISIGQYALARWHDHLMDKEGAIEHFMRIADWFVSEAVCSPSGGALWLTEVPKPEYEVTSPWPSAFAQSRAISVLLRAWQHTGEERYFILACKALQPFERDISEGGVSVDRATPGIAFYEEYVAQWPTRVLDGHSFALFGLYDFIRAAPKDSEHHGKAVRLFEEGIEGLKYHLSYYDTGTWLRFNRCERPGYPNEDPCTIGYLKLVIAQMRVLYSMTGDAQFDALARKWKKYLTPKGIWNMYYEKWHTLRKLNRL